jgi:hypothetical protein
MEILQILRSHLDNNKTSFTPDIEVFSAILDDIEKQLSIDLNDGKNELHYDQYIAQCIDLEGIKLVWKNSHKRSLSYRS